MCVHKIMQVYTRGVIDWPPVDAANLGLGCAFTSNLHFYYWQSLTYQSDLQESARIV